MGHTMPKLCDHHDRYVCVINVPGGDIYTKVAETPSNHVMKINSTREEAQEWIITGDDEITLGFMNRGKESRVFPHSGKVQDGRRLMVGNSSEDHNHPNRKFTKRPLHCGGFYITSVVDPTLYIGIVDDHWTLTKIPHTWFFTYPILSP